MAPRLDTIDAVNVELHDIAALRLRHVGQRYTTGRQRVVELLAASPRPLSIPDLVADPSFRIPQSSAYRNLAVLEQAGVVHRIHTTSDFARYELANDLTEHHHHLICTVCGSVTDFTAPPSLERGLDKVMHEVNGAGFRVESHRLDLMGVCAACD